MINEAVNDGKKAAVEMLEQMKRSAEVDIYAVGENQQNILFEYVKQIKQCPNCTHVLAGFCSVLTDKLALGGDTEIYKELLN